jgi:hypothetical protein
MNCTISVRRKKKRKKKTKKKVYQITPSFRIVLFAQSIMPRNCGLVELCVCNRTCGFSVFQASSVRFGTEKSKRKKRSQTLMVSRGWPIATCVQNEGGKEAKSNFSNRSERTAKKKESTLVPFLENCPQ